MSYKDPEKQKACMRGYHVSNRVERLSYMKERRRLIKEGLFEKKDTKRFVRKKDEGLFEKKLEVKLKPGDRGYCDIRPYLEIKPKEEEPDSKDDSGDKTASPVVSKPKKPPVKAEASVAVDIEKASDDLENMFDE